MRAEIEFAGITDDALLRGAVLHRRQIARSEMTVGVCVPRRAHSTPSNIQEDFP
jgi:hypothetical protein